MAVEGRPPRSSISRWLVVVGVAVATFALCALIASRGEVPGWEEAPFHAINDLPDWLYAPMWGLQFSDGLLFVVIIVTVGAAGFVRWRLAAALVVLVPLELIVEKLVVKRLVERERPGTSICGAPDEFVEACGNLRGDVPLDGLSFVSGHAIIAWAAPPCSGRCSPGRWKWLPVALAPSTRSPGCTSAPTTSSMSSGAGRSVSRWAPC